MNTKEETNGTIGVVIGHTTDITKDVCRSFARQGISTIVVQKESYTHDVEEAPEQNHWSGQPGKDLFFNGWKLLF